MLHDLVCSSAEKYVIRRRRIEVLDQNECEGIGQQQCDGENGESSITTSGERGHWAPPLKSKVDALDRPERKGKIKIATRKVHRLEAMLDDARVLDERERDDGP